MEAPAESSAPAESNACLPLAGADALQQLVASLDRAIAPFRQHGTQAGAPHEALQAVAQQDRERQARLPSAEQAALWLQQQPGYRVLRQLTPLPAAEGQVRAPALKQVAFVDAMVVADPRRGAQVNDIACAVVAVDPSDMSWLGLTASFGLRGRLGDAEAARFERSMADVDLVVVHGARVLRHVLEVRFKPLAALPWVCSKEALRWSSTPNLEFQCMRLGYFFNAASTLQRAHALSRLVCEAAVSGGGASSPMLQAVVEASSAVEMRVLYRLADASASSADGIREQLHATGFQWSDEDGAYVLSLQDGQQVQACVRRLSSVPRIKGHVTVETIDARVRYSRRRGAIEKLALVGTA